MRRKDREITDRSALEAGTVLYLAGIQRGAGRCSGVPR